VTNLKKGSKGSAVKDVQDRLNSIGYPLTVDGSFGPGTETAVKQFQTEHGLSADGIIGPETWGYLMPGVPTPPPAASSAPASSAPASSAPRGARDAAKAGLPPPASGGGIAGLSTPAKVGIGAALVIVLVGIASKVLGKK
jgi:peptidoglycan hydrolase-like protein with peptidoglycan-binding domain